jgi:hypothetical protein
MSMMFWDKKKSMDSILQKRKSGGGPIEVGPVPMKNENVSDKDGVPDARMSAAEDVMGAFHEKSAEKLMRALANFNDIHASSPHSMDPRDDEKV